MDCNGNFQTILETVVRFFEEDHWHIQFVESKPVIRTAYHGEHGTWICYARVDELQHRFLFHSLTGLNIPPQYRISVAEYLTRANFGLPAGNFEMSMDSGEIRFKTSLEALECGISLEMIRTIVNTNVQSMDHYFPGIVAVVHGALSPAAALARVEAQASESAIGN